MPFAPSSVLFLEGDGSNHSGRRGDGSKLDVKSLAGAQLAPGAASWLREAQVANGRVLQDYWAQVEPGMT